MDFFGFSQLQLASTLFCLMLISLAIIDFKTMRLPNFLTIPLIIFGCLYNVLSSIPLTTPLGSFWGALFGFASLWGINRIYLLATGKAGIGMGDAKLLAGIGALLGANAIIPTLFIASLLGIIGGLIWLRLHHQSKDKAFPFGPYLAIAGIALILDSNLKIGILQYLAL